MIEGEPCIGGLQMYALHVLSPCGRNGFDFSEFIIHANRELNEYRGSSCLWKGRHITPPLVAQVHLVYTICTLHVLWRGCIEKCHWGTK